MTGEYLKVLKRERDREYHWRKSKQGEFESSILSYDQIVDSFDDPGKIAAFSDGGAGARKVVGRADEIESALSRLCPADIHFAECILAGKDWREMGVPKATFYRKLKKVCAKVRLHPQKHSL